MTVSRTKGGSIRGIREYESSEDCVVERKKDGAGALRISSEKGGSEDGTEQRLLQRPAFSRHGSSASAHFA